MPMRLVFLAEAVRSPAEEPRSSTAIVPLRGLLARREATLAGKKKTTFAKMNREAKVREKRLASSLRKEQRQRDRAAGILVEHQVEDLSHLDVAVVAGVVPDVSVNR